MVVAGGVIVLSASLGRPIWIDEFLHFAFGGYDSAAEVWRTIRSTGLNVNFGQTGIYMMLDFGLLKAFGASALWLRMPSVLSAALLLYATVRLFRSEGHVFFWPLVAILVFFCRPDFMYYAGEARPYMPLAAAAVGVLAFYGLSPEQRKRWPAKLLGYASVIWGAAMHPYFSVYWLALACFTYWQRNADTSRWSIRAFVAHCDPALVAVGAALYFLVGAATWLRGGPDLNLDPLQFMSEQGLLRNFDHRYFGIVHGYALLLLNGVFSAATLALPAVEAPEARRLGTVAGALHPHPDGAVHFGAVVA